MPERSSRFLHKRGLQLFQECVGLARAWFMVNLWSGNRVERSTEDDHSIRRDECMSRPPCNRQCGVKRHRPVLRFRVNRIEWRNNEEERHWPRTRTISRLAPPLLREDRRLLRSLVAAHKRTTEACGLSFENAYVSAPLAHASPYLVGIGHTNNLSATERITLVDECQRKNARAR